MNLFVAMLKIQETETGTQRIAKMENYEKDAPKLNNQHYKLRNILGKNLKAFLVKMDCVRFTRVQGQLAMLRHHTKVA